MTLTPQGYKRRSYNEYLEMLQNEAKERFGDDINLNDDSTLGKFLKLIAYKDSQIDERTESVYNAGSIDVATDISLDFEAKKIGLSRRPSQPSRVIETINGDPGTIIPVGYIISNAEGTIPFVSTEVITLDSTGVGVGEFECTIKGIIGNLPARTINTIRTAIVGVNSVYNELQAEGGLERESDSQFRARYFESLSVGGGSSTDSLRASIFELPGVIDVSVDENDSDVTVNGIPPHSIAPFVYGGDDEDIAKTILQYKAGGIRSHGDVVVTVYDSQGKPKMIGFTRPQNVHLRVVITLNVQPTFPSEGVEEVKNNVLNYIGGTKDNVSVQGLGLGEDVVEFKIFGAIASTPGINSADIQFYVNGSTTPISGTVPIASNEIATVDYDDIEVVIN